MANACRALARGDGMAGWPPWVNGRLRDSRALVAAAVAARYPGGRLAREAP
tara:strand:+ start:436 stop:588 length:153 start_codon:yes stop_codon:yes gene_type:complete